MNARVTVIGKDISDVAGVGIAAFYGGENVQYTTIAEEKAGEHGAIIEILQRAAAEGMRCHRRRIPLSTIQRRR